MSVKQTAKRAKVVVECGKEIYHLESMRSEYGEHSVINKIAVVLGEREALPTADAFKRASQILMDMDKLKRQEFGFKEMRAEMKRDSLTHHKAIPEYWMTLGEA